MSVTFEPVTTGRISTQIVDQIQEVIRSGELQPGDRLPAERVLAENFGVSRVTVRDAIRVLEVLGLVEVRVGAAGGAFVTAPSTDVVGEGLTNLLLMQSVEANDIVEARLLMELNVVTLAVERANELDIKILQDVCDRAEESLAQGTYDRTLSAEFHKQLVKATHNSALALLSESFTGPLSMGAVRRQEGEDRPYHTSVEEHKAITKAIVDRDQVRAQQLVIAHLAERSSLEDYERLIRHGTCCS